MKRMKRRLFALAAAIALGGVVPSSAADEPYDLWVMLPVTGQAAFLGRDEVPVVHAIEQYANSHGGIAGRPLRINILDDQSNPSVGAQLASQILSKNVPVIVGPVLSSVCGAVAGLIGADGPVLYCLSPVGDVRPGGNVFLISVDNRDAVASGLRYLKAHGVRTLALLQTTDTPGVSGEKAVQEAIRYPELRDMRIVDIEHYAPTDLSVAAQAARIKASGAQALINFVLGPPFGTAMHAVFDSGYAGYVLGSSAVASKEQMRQYAGFLPDKLIITTLGFLTTGRQPAQLRAARATYLDIVRQNGVTEPTTGSLAPWDPLWIVIEGLRKYGTGVTPRQMRDYIASVHDYPGIMGMYDFRRGDQRGVDPKSTGVMRYDKATGEFVVLSQAGGEPL